MTRTSFVAVATVLPASIAASVGCSAAAPVMATQTTSASMAAMSHAASSPEAQPDGSSSPAGGVTTAVRVTPNRAATASSAATSLPATAPTSSKRSGNLAITSHACRPIEPVAPSRTTRRRDVGNVTCVQRPRCEVEQSTPPLSQWLRECDQLQVAIYDRGQQDNG